MIEFYFATENDHKIEEANAALERFKIKTEKLTNFEKIEIQHPDLQEIASTALTLIIQKHQERIIVEDSGLFVHALNGFPGPFSSQTFDSIGVEGILKLLQGAKTRKAEFRSAVAFGFKGEILSTFSSVTEGNIAMEPRGQGGFGFDPIFTPMWTQKTFAEMSLKEKSVYSHRAKALTKLALWYLNYSKQKFSQVKK